MLQHFQASELKSEGISCLTQLQLVQKLKNEIISKRRDIHTLPDYLARVKTLQKYLEFAQNGVLKPCFLHYQDVIFKNTPKYIIPVIYEVLILEYGGPQMDREE